MIDEKAFLGIPILFKDICIIYPPKILDISKISYKIFLQYTKILTITQDEIQDNFYKDKIEDFKKTKVSNEEESKAKELILNKMNEMLDNPFTPFEYILNNAYNNEEFKQILEKSFYFFTNEKIVFAFEDKKIIIIGENKTTKIIDENIFFDFQNEIRKSVGEKIIEPYDPNEDPRIKKIKAKARKRDKIKAAQEEKKGLALDLGTLMCGICCMNNSINSLNIREMTYASIKNQLKMGQYKEKYEKDIQTLIGGGDSKKIKPKYYLRNLDDD